MISHKKQKIKREKKIFKNAKDEKQYLLIVSTLNDIINHNNNKFNDDGNIYPKIPQSILQEIGQYSTGNCIKCVGELDHDECNGYIHFLFGDNFEQTTNSFAINCNLFNYECDDSQCNQRCNILCCSVENCDSIQQTKCYTKNALYSQICKNACIEKPTCTQSYCHKHLKNIVQCQECSNYYCNDCQKYNGIHCIKCNDYLCNECQQQQDCEFLYCDQCLFSSHVIIPQDFHFD